ncbi:hypothetical protein ACFLZY_00310 [Patescibacteria group bacterium]
MVCIFGFALTLFFIIDTLRGLLILTYGGNMVDLRKMYPFAETDLVARGTEYINLKVQVVLTGSIYINAESNGQLAKGVLLIAKRPALFDETRSFSVYDFGLYSALRSADIHTRSYYQAEQQKIEMAQGDLAFALQLCWGLHHHHPEREEVYHQTLRQVMAQMHTARSSLKLTVGTKAKQASRIRDCLERFNPGSRAPIIWSADHLLREQYQLSNEMLELVNKRVMALVRLHGQIMDLCTDSLRAVSQAQIKLPDLGDLPDDYIERLIRRLATTAENLDAVLVAPYGTRSFPKCAKNLRQAVDCLRRDEFDQAYDQLDLTRRALELLGIHQTLEELLCSVTALCQNKSQDTISLVDHNSFCDQLSALLDEVDNDTLDAGFENRILDDVRQYLGLAQEVAKSDRGFNVDAIRLALKRACNCF